MVGDDSLSKRPMDRVAIPLRQMGVEIAGQEIMIHLTWKRNPSSNRFITVRQWHRLKSSLLIFAAHKLEGESTIVEKEKTRGPYGGYDSPIWWRDPSGWKPSASKVDKSSASRSQCSWYFQCSLWLVAGPHSSRECDHDWKCWYQPNAARILDVIQEMGGDLTIDDRDEKRSRKFTVRLRP